MVVTSFVRINDKHQRFKALKSIFKTCRVASMTSVTLLNNIYYKVLVYGCMDVYECLKAKKNSSCIINQKETDIFIILLYKYRLLYGPLKPQKKLGERTFGRLVYGSRLFILYQIGPFSYLHIIKFTYPQSTVLNKSFATLHICQIISTLCFTNHSKVFIVNEINYPHKQTNIFHIILSIGCCFIGKTIHQGYTTKSAQNKHIHKYDSNNAPYFFHHTMVFCLKIRLSNACSLVADILIIDFLGRLFLDPPTLRAVIAHKRNNKILIGLFL